MTETVAVVVVTYNRAALLTRMLAGLAALDRTPDAVIVVDNASTDHTATVLAGVTDLPLQVDVRDLARGRAARRGALEPQHASAPPLQSHQAFAAGAFADRRQERLLELPLVERPERRIGQEADLRPRSLAVQPLDELVVGRPAAEAGRQHFFDHAHDVGIEQRRAGRGELLEAAHLVEVEAPALALQRLDNRAGFRRVVGPVPR